MNKMFNTSIFIVIFFISSISMVMSDPDHDDDNKIIFSKLPTSLKSSISDMTATYVEDLKGNGVEAIIITGGCSGKNLEVTRDNRTSYECDDVTNGVHIFYPSTENIDTVAPMPSERYRHSAALVNGKLYVIGGRNLNDDLIKDVIVYDPNDGDLGSWETFMTLKDEDATSDHASFGKDGSIYVLGGYDATYTARDDIFTIDVETTNIVKLASMSTKRGDAQAVYYNQDGIEAIYTVGGFSHETTVAFCEPLIHGEKYDFKTNTWTDISPIENKRGDKGLIVINGKIIAIGGESKHESLCKGTESEVNPASHSIAVDDVESYNPQDGDDAEWHSESDFPHLRFRFAAAVSKKLDKAYVFGGQLAYDINCTCYPTTSDIFYFRDNGVSGRRIGFALSIIVGSFISLLW